MCRCARIIAHLDHLICLIGGESLASQSIPMTALEYPSQSDAEHRDEWNRQRHEIDSFVEPDHLTLRQLFSTREDVHIDQRHDDAPADDRNTPECLHGGMHE